MAVSELAAAELNAGSGIAGREVELMYLDGGQKPARVAREVAALIDSRRIDALTGWHISSVRQHLAPVAKGRIPYVYTSLYEGGESNSSVYFSGETPEQQVLPAMRWLRDYQGVRSWFVVGAKYVWPIRSRHMIYKFASALDVEIAGEAFVEMGSADDPKLPQLAARSGCTGVITLLVGQDAVHFNRHFAAHGLDESIVRFSPLMEENMLLASGVEATRNLYSSAAYFRSLATASSLDLIGKYTDDQGAQGPALNNMAQSCYQGIYTLAHLAHQSGSMEVDHHDAAVDGLTFESPRGVIRFDGNQAIQRIYLAHADGLDFQVIGELPTKD